MLCSPLDHQTLCAWWKAALKHDQGVDIDQCLVSSIKGVKMSGPMVIEVHADDDSKEPRELRHPRRCRLRPARLPQPASQ